MKFSSTAGSTGGQGYDEDDDGSLVDDNASNDDSARFVSLIRDEMPDVVATSCLPNLMTRTKHNKMIVTLCLTCRPAKSKDESDIL